MSTTARADPELLPSFEDVDLFDWLQEPAHRHDALPFGVIAMNQDGIVVAYNAFESEHARLRPDQVLGRHFFRDVGPCMNNYLVAQRFEDEADLDAQLDFVFTFVMRPTRVRLRLLARAGVPRRYLTTRYR